MTAEAVVPSTTEQSQARVPAAATTTEPEATSIAVGELEPSMAAVTQLAPLGVAPTAVADSSLDGAVLFVDERPDGAPGTTLTITDSELRIQHQLGYDSSPFAQSLGYPNVALVRLFEPRAVHLVRADTGQQVQIAGPDDPELVFYPPSVGPDQIGHRFVPVAYGVAGGRSFVLDLEDLALRQVRAGIPAIAPDGSWLASVAVDHLDGGSCRGAGVSRSLADRPGQWRNPGSGSTSINRTGRRSNRAWMD
ncbi:MAG: hypothetical protein ACKVHU_10095 [Acidimicrobiales bacterium]